MTTRFRQGGTTRREPQSQVSGDRGPADRFSVAVCICTKDRTEELARALDSVRRSRVSPTEVIVSDDGAAGAAERMLRGRFPEVRWLCGPRAGLGANRNHVAAAAASDTVLFLDDDAELTTDFLGEVQACREDQPETLRDRTIVTGNESRAGTLIEPAEQDFLGYQRRPYPALAELMTIVVNSAVIPRGAVAEVGFDPRLVYGYDEVDFTARAVQAGYRIVPCPSAVNVHHVSPHSREGYEQRVQAARLYVTLKRRALVEGRRAAGMAFLVAAVPHMLASGLRREGVAGLGAACRAILEGLRMTGSYALSARAARRRELNP